MHMCMLRSNTSERVVCIRKKQCLYYFTTPMLLYYSKHKEVRAFSAHRVERKIFVHIYIEKDREEKVIFGYVFPPPLRSSKLIFLSHTHTSVLLCITALFNPRNSCISHAYMYYTYTVNITDLLNF